MDYFRDDPAAGQRIETLWAWVAIHADGREGVWSADMETPIGPRHMPLVTSKRDVAERLAAVVLQLQRAALAETGKPIHAELREFRVVR